MHPESRQTRSLTHALLPATPVAGAGARRRVFKRVLAGVGLTLLAACGQRGPLYLPDPNDPTKKRS